MALRQRFSLDWNRADHAGHAVRTLRAIRAMTDQWITKEEAGARLGSPERPLSARRVLELAKAGRLQSTLVRDDNNGHMTVRIHAGSVERFIFERDNPSNGEEKRAVQPRGPRNSHDPHDLIEQVIRYLATIARPALSAPSARLWLTITESAAYSGLPVTVISELIRQDRLKAMDVGRRRRGGRWRIRRVDLEGFAG